MPKKSVITDQKKEALFQALRDKLPLSYACDIIGIPRQTVYDWIKKNELFRAQIAIAKSQAIRDLVETTEKQGGAWKLLKNLAKEEFKEHVEIKEEATHQLFVSVDDDEQEVFDL